jgi:2-keto-4-pentenoate hydratase/2-oxohepta-3-ene-1,7-dioic acid hydratase in catechol pathway
VNGELRQNGNTSDLIFDIPTLIEFLSQGTTLKKGSLIVTGTPGGVGFAMKPPKFLRDGDVVEISIEKIGTLVHGISYPKKIKSDS